MSLANLFNIGANGEPKVTLQTQGSYGVGQVGGQILRDVPSLLLLFFMTNVLGVPAAIAGTAIFVPKLFVGVSSDLIIGAIADRMKARMSLYWWVLIGAIGAPIAMYLLFHIPDTKQNSQIAYVIGAMSFYMLVLACFAVPYLAIAASIANTAHQRTVLMAWRLFFTAIGLLVAGAAAPAFVARWGGGKEAYSLMAIYLAAVCFVTMLIAFWASRNAVKSVDDAAGLIELKIDLKAMLNAVKMQRFSILLIVSVLQLTGAGMGYATMLYFLQSVMVLENPFDALGLLITAIIAGIVIAQPVWVAVAKRLGKKHSYVIASLVHAAAILLWSLAGPQLGLNAVIAFAVLAGIGNSGWAMLGFSMMSDIAGEGRSGLYSSVFIAADKIGIALGGTLIAGLILSGFGYDSVKAVSGVAQSDTGVLGIVVAFGIVPACLYLIGAVVFSIWGSSSESQAT